MRKFEPARAGQDDPSIRRNVSYLIERVGIGGCAVYCAYAPDVAPMDWSDGPLPELKRPPRRLSLLLPWQDEHNPYPT